MSDAATIKLAQEYFDTLHSLWHQHGCAPGDVEWAPTTSDGAIVMPGYTRAVTLAQDIFDMTGQWPLPCDICNYRLRRAEEERRTRQHV